MTTYRVDFGPAWPIPPITVDFADHGTAIEAVTKHAIPYLRPVLAEKGRPECADCFFRTDRDLTEGSFMWVNLAEGMSALFCPARLTPVDEPAATETRAVADGCPGFESNPVATDLCVGCGESRRWHDATPARL